ncbi:MAG: hypothetical protein R3D27_12405 [Hyphomicrobiaceae bacterium]
MSRNFHEQFDRGEALAMPSNRSTGFVLAAALAIFAVLFRHKMAIAAPLTGASALLATAAALRPTALTQITRAWFQLGLLLNRIVSPIVLFVMFAAVIVPYGLVMQLLRDPLRRRARSADLPSYWIDAATKDVPPADLRRQF